MPLPCLFLDQLLSFLLSSLIIFYFLTAFSLNTTSLAILRFERRIPSILISWFLILITKTRLQHGEINYGNRTFLCHTLFDMIFHLITCIIYLGCYYIFWAKFASIPFLLIALLKATLLLLWRLNQKLSHSLQMSYKVVFILI